MNENDMKSLREITEHFNVPLVEDRGTIASDFQDFLNATKEEVGIEGYILRFHDGRSYKIKTEEYVLLHKAQDALSQEKDVWRIIISGAADDLKPLLLDEELLVDFNDFEVKFWSEFDRIVKEIETFVIKHKAKIEDEIDADMFDDYERVCKKEFALNAVPLVDKFLTRVVFRVYDGYNTRDELLQLVHSNTGTNSNVDKFRVLFNGLRWQRYTETE